MVRCVDNQDDEASCVAGVALEYGSRGKLCFYTFRSIYIYHNDTTCAISVTL